MARLTTSLFRGAYTCLAGMADLLLPDVCGACGAAPVAAEGLCPPCNLELLSLVAMPFCPRCGHTLGPNVPADEDGCGGCPPTLGHFDRVFRLGPYTACLRRAIRDMKYHRRQRLRRRLTDLLAHRIATDWPGEDFDAVVTVPMHWLRRLQRGFDHARSIASRLAAALALPLGNDLIRIRNTPPQTHLPRSRRIENVRGAFALRSADTVRGASLLLVDDVTTTGATVDEATRILLKAGAHHVAVAVFAKAEAPTAYAAHLQEP